MPSTGSDTAYPRTVVRNPLTVVFLWAFQLRRRAFRYIFSHSVITPLQKDAAPIPNAEGLSCD
ncbi:MAG: hypothetical protein IKW51_02910 [Bacteroidales bacterium]|nr:hypothetical protein [Bacteroidales bacterium]